MLTADFLGTWDVWNHMGPTSTFREHHPRPAKSSTRAACVGYRQHETCPATSEDYMGICRGNGECVPSGNRVQCCGGSPGPATTCQFREHRLHLQTLPSHASSLASCCSLLTPVTSSPRSALDSSITDHCAIPAEPTLSARVTIVLDAGLSLSNDIRHAIDDEGG